MRSCPPLFRRGAVYYLRLSARWSDGATYRIALSLLTRRLAVAKPRALRLADYADAVRRSLEHRPGQPPLSQAERKALFSRLLHAERDRIEALHLDLLEQMPASAVPEAYVAAVFDE